MLAFFSVSRFMARMLVVNPVAGRPSGLARFLLSFGIFLLVIVAIGRMAAEQVVDAAPAWRPEAPKAPVPQELLDAARGRK